MNNNLMELAKVKQSSKRPLKAFIFSQKNYKVGDQKFNFVFKIISLNVIISHLVIECGLENVH